MLITIWALGIDTPSGVLPPRCFLFLNSLACAVHVRYVDIMFASDRNEMNWKI